MRWDHGTAKVPASLNNLWSQPPAMASQSWAWHLVSGLWVSFKCVKIIETKEGIGEMYIILEPVGTKFLVTKKSPRKHYQCEPLLTNLMWCMNDGFKHFPPIFTPQIANRSVDPNGRTKHKHPAILGDHQLDASKVVTS